MELEVTLYISASDETEVSDVRESLDLLLSNGCEAGFFQTFSIDKIDS